MLSSILTRLILPSRYNQARHGQDPFSLSFSFNEKVRTRTVPLIRRVVTSLNACLLSVTFDLGYCAEIEIFRFVSSRSMHFSSIEGLPEGLFANTPLLQSLIVSSAKLSSLPAEVFDPLNDLQYL